MKKSLKSCVSGYSCGPFSISKRPCCLHEMCKFTGTGKMESGINPLGSALQSSCSCSSVPQGKQETCYHFTMLSAAIDACIHIHIRCQQHGTTWSPSNTKEVAGGLKACPQRSHWTARPFGRTNLTPAQQFRAPPASMDAFDVFLPPVFLGQQDQRLEQLILLHISWETWATFDYVSVSMQSWLLRREF